mmetsp:Transcript_70/g.181  ORF Transcript_70/g.181 Transcript_70/m.181 type:complete len:240 (+) Transcript_70:22-741(+)
MMSAFFARRKPSGSVCGVGREALGLGKTTPAAKKNRGKSDGKRGDGKTQLLFSVGKANDLLKKRPGEEDEPRARKRFRESDVVERVGETIKIVRVRDRGDVTDVVDAELGASARVSARSKAYAAVDKGAVVGAIVCEPAATATDGTAVDLGVDKIWVRPSHRRRGVATALLDAARRHFFFNFEVPIPRFAVSQPTAEGRALFEAYLRRKRRRQEPQEGHREEQGAPLPLLVYEADASSS